MSSIFLDVHSAADFLKVKVSTIYAWVHQRRLPFRKHGRRVVFSRDELEIWSKSQSVSATFSAGFGNATDHDTEGAKFFENQAHR